MKNASHQQRINANKMDKWFYGYMVLWFKLLKLCKINTYSQGSVKESFDWNEKSKVRKLLNNEQYCHILGKLQKLTKEINQQISLTNKKLTI